MWLSIHFYVIRRIIMISFLSVITFLNLYTCIRTGERKFLFLLNKFPKKKASLACNESAKQKQNKNIFCVVTDE